MKTWKETHTSLAQEMFVLDPNEVLSAEEDYFVILAMCLVDFT